MPAMADLALPAEPSFTATDIPQDTPANWKIPENFYTKDTRWEAVAITVNGNTSDDIAEGQVSISWRP